MNIIKNCKDCELTSDSCGVVCMSDIQPLPEKIFIDLDVLNPPKDSKLNKQCVNCEDYYAECFPCLGSAADSVNDCYTPRFEKPAAAPSPSVPAVESRPPVPEYFASRVVSANDFDPTTSLTDFIELLHHVGFMGTNPFYDAIFTNLMNIQCADVSNFIPLSELTVHQIVSAIYAAAEEQSK